MWSLHFSDICMVMCLSFGLLRRKLTVSQQQTQTGRSEWLQISIWDARPSRIHVLMGALDCHRGKAWKLTGQSYFLCESLDICLRKSQSFRLPQQQHVDWLITVWQEEVYLLSAVTFCRQNAVTETRKSMQMHVEVTKTVSQTTKYYIHNEVVVTSC